jgi:hypothetical protein
MVVTPDGTVEADIVMKAQDRTQTTWDALSRAGEVLTLQLLFVLTSLPIVTVVPAALALQRSLHQLLVLKAPKPSPLFFENFRWAVRGFWVVGLGAALGVATISSAGVFWWSTTLPGRWIPLSLVCLVGGLALAGYLSLLAVATTAPAVCSLRRAWPAVLHVLSTRSLALALAVTLEIIWLNFAVRFPTILLIGSGLVPAGIVWHLVARPWSQDDA